MDTRANGILAKTVSLIAVGLPRDVVAMVIGSNGNIPIN